jgi:hypothetical protein
LSRHAGWSPTWLRRRRCARAETAVERAQGSTSKTVVRNRGLADAIYLWAFASLAASEGKRAFYDARRAGGDGHHQALRALGNRLVGILHGCLAIHTTY